MKNLKDRVVSILLVFAVVGTSYGFRVVTTDMITEIYAKEISGVSENDAESAENDNEDMNTEPMVEDTDIDADEQLITDGVEDVPVWGNRASRKDMVEWKKLYPEENNYVFTLPDCDTWTYQQTYARNEIFKYLNETRMKVSNWWMNDNNGKKVDGLPYDQTTLTHSYVYDYNLEAAAMQRAAELAVLYSSDDHLRPDCMKPAETYLEAWSEPVKKMDSEEDISTDKVNPYWYSENTCELITVYESDTDIRSQHGDYMGIVEDFMEENEPAGRQGHRKAILTDKFYRIGIGCIKTDENKYFVAVELGEEGYEYDYSKAYKEYEIPLAPETTAVDTYMPVTIRIAPGLNMQCGLLENRYGNPTVTLKTGDAYSFGDRYFSECTTTVALWKGSDPAMGTEWYSTNEAVATVEGTTIIAKGSGSCQILSRNGIYATGLIDIKVESPTPAVSPAPSTTPTVKPSADPSPSPAPSAKPSATPSAAPSVQPSSTPTQAPQKIEVAKRFKKTCIVKYKDIRKKKKTLKLGVKVNKGKAHGIVTYKVTKYPKGAKKCVTVNKKGVVTIKKRAKKGTYKIKVTANANAIMKKATKTVTIKIK